MQWLGETDLRFYNTAYLLCVGIVLLLECTAENIDNKNAKVRICHMFSFVFPPTCY